MSSSCADIDRFGKLQSRGASDEGGSRELRAFWEALRPRANSRCEVEGKKKGCCEKHEGDVRQKARRDGCLEGCPVVMQRLQRFQRGREGVSLIMSTRCPHVACSTSALDSSHSPLPGRTPGSFWAQRKGDTLRTAMQSRSFAYALSPIPAPAPHLHLHGCLALA